MAVKVQYLHVTQNQETITIATSWSCPFLSFPDNRQLWLAPLPWVEGLQYPLLATGCYSRQSVLRTAWFLCNFFFKQLPPCCCCCCLKTRTSHQMTKKNQMHPTLSGASFVCFEVVQREKWNDPSLNENNAGVESPPPPLPPPAWKPLWVVKSPYSTKQEKRFHVQFVSVKNRQCPIFATSSPPYFVLDKTLFWKNKYKKQQQKKVFTSLHCAVLHMHNTPHSRLIWTVNCFWQSVLTMSLFSFFFF